ncbi:MAG: lipopolysaccharide biosynthesis protein [Kofleriaceae bacterium]
MTKGVGKRTLSGISWTLFGSVVANATRFAVIPILVRLLTPADFGLVAVALTVVAFAIRFAQLGLGAALIQRKEITDEHIATTFAWMLALGIGFTVALFAGAPLVAAIFDMPQSENLVRALSALFFIRSLSSTSRFLLQRDLHFKALASMNVAAYIIGSVTSVTLAYAGFGPWSLAIGYLVEAIVESALLLIARPPVVRPAFHRQAFNDLFGFGGGQTIASIANYFAQQGDYIVVGRYLGDVMLGIYSRAYELMRFPALVFHSVAGTVLFSSFSRIQDDPERLESSFRRVLFANAIVLMPASAGLIVLAPEAIAILFGKQWTSVVIPFQIMAVSLLFRTSYKASGLVARSAGEIMRVAAGEVIYAGMVFFGALFAKRWGIIGVSVTTGLAIILQFFIVTSMAIRRIPSGWSCVMRAHIDGLMMAASVVATALPVAFVLRGIGAHIVVVAVVGTIAGSIGPVVFAWARLRRGDEDWVFVRDRIVQVLTRKKKKASVPAEPI